MPKRRTTRPRREAHPPFAPQPLEPRALLAAVAWDGDANDGDFTNPVNWEGDVMPGPADDATIAPGAGPAIILWAAKSANLRSLTVDWPLILSGALNVSGEMTVGDTALDIGRYGRVTTHNLTLEASSAPLLSQGQWTITGTSTINRRITSTSTGTLTIETDAAITMGVGLGIPDTFGAIEASGGTLRIQDRVRILGFGNNLTQLSAHRLEVGRSVLLHNLGIRVFEPDSPYSSLRFSDLARATISYSTLTLGGAYVTGQFDLLDSTLILTGQNSAASTSRLRADRTTIQVLGRFWAGGTLEVTDSAIVLGDPGAEPTSRLIGSAVTIVDSNITTLERAEISGALTLRDTTIGGSGPLVATGTSLTLHHVDILAGGRLNTIVPAVLDDVWVAGELHLGRNAEWVGGFIDLVFASSRLRIGSQTTLAVIDDASNIGGSGRVVNHGAFVVDVDNLIRVGDFSNAGVVEARRGKIEFRENVVQLSAQGTLSGGEWRVKPAGTLQFYEATVTSLSATMVISGGGTIVNFSALTRNNGTIIFDGAGAWPDPSGSASFLNNGIIRKTGVGVRTIPGVITQGSGGRLIVETGRLLLDTARFENHGRVLLGIQGDPGTRATNARLQITGDFAQPEGGRLFVFGAEGDNPADLPRIIVGGAMHLGGSLNIETAVNTFAASQTTWVLANASVRTGQFDQATIFLRDASGTPVYTLKQFKVRVVR